MIYKSISSETFIQYLSMYFKHFATLILRHISRRSVSPSTKCDWYTIGAPFITAVIDWTTQGRWNLVAGYGSCSNNIWEFDYCLPQSAIPIFRRFIQTCHTNILELPTALNCTLKWFYLHGYTWIYKHRKWMEWNIGEEQMKYG